MPWKTAEDIEEHQEGINAKALKHKHSYYGCHGIA
jgi:hypothetical protein